MQNIARLPALEIRDLRLMLALSTAGSTARAASLMHLTQPAVSRALLAMEDKLGTQLFERTARGLAPTAAGRLLLEGAERMLATLTDLEHRVRANKPEPLRLRIVCECYTAYHWLPSALLELRKLLPGFEVAIAIEHTDAPIAALEAGAIDAALLTTSHAARGSGLRERPLFSDEVVFVMSAEHPLATRKALTPTDLRRHTLITSRVPTGEAQWFAKKVFGTARPRLRFEILPLTEAILDVARATLGIAIMSEWIAGPHLGKRDLITKRLTKGPLQRPWHIAYRPDAEASVLRLCAVLEASLPRTRAQTI